jgi:hypothetical protein
MATGHGRAEKMAGLILEAAVGGNSRTVDAVPCLVRAICARVSASVGNDLRTHLQTAAWQMFQWHWVTVSIPKRKPSLEITS